MERWTFSREMEKRVLGNLAYLRRCFGLLNMIQNAIPLYYEDICNPNFSNPRLDSFFGRPIRIEMPQVSTHGRDYVTNWDDFNSFVRNASKRLREREK